MWPFSGISLYHASCPLFGTRKVQQDVRSIHAVDTEFQFLVKNMILHQLSHVLRSSGRMNTSHEHQHPKSALHVGYAENSWIVHSSEVPNRTETMTLNAKDTQLGWHKLHTTRLSIQDASMIFLQGIRVFMCCVFRSMLSVYASLTELPVWP